MLDGLFHRLVVLAEADQDCRFYGAALEQLRDADGLTVPAGEMLFVPGGGKDRLHKLAKALGAVSVPITICADLDLLNDQAAVRSAVEALGQDWELFKRDYRLQRNHSERLVM